MAILPVDLQALLLRLGDASRPHQREAEGAVLAQTAKAEEVAKQAQVDSTRVNEVKAHPDLNNKIEPDGRGKQRSPGRGGGRSGGGGPSGSGSPGSGSPGSSPGAPPGSPRRLRKAEGSGAARPLDIERHYKGTIIDTKV